MKRFNFFRFVFALVCGCHIIGVQSNRRSHGIYLDPNEQCRGPPYDDQSSVVQIVPGPNTCGAIETALNVIKDEYPGHIASLDDCHRYCQSDRNCTHIEFDENNKKCSFTWKKSFGTKKKHIVTGYGECPQTGKCPYLGMDFLGGIFLGRKSGINSPTECQKYCRLTYGSKAVINYGFVLRRCVCKKVLSSRLGYDGEWISGPSRCHPCFGYKFDLSKLQNVYNGSPQPFLIKPTAKACQISCKANRLCRQFQFDPRTGKCLHKNHLTARMKKCNTAFASKDCDGIFDCKPCNPEGVINGDLSCGLLGYCLSCNEQQGHTGKDCYSCKPEHYKDGNKCKACNCDKYGSRSQSCNKRISGYGLGQCPCYFDSYEGKQCQNCVKGQIKANGRCCFDQDYYHLKNKRCEDCNCDQIGSKSVDCDPNTGQCPCKDNYNGRRCNECVSGYRKTNDRCCRNQYYYDKDSESCEDCNCDSVGSKSQNCDTKSGQCICNTGYYYRRCDNCAWNYRYIKGLCCSKTNQYNPHNQCVDCDCHKGGSTGTKCTAWNNNGNCYCKHRYKGRRCYEVGRETASWSKGRLGKYNTAVRRNYIVLKHECYSHYPSCDLRYLEIKSYGKDVDFWGSTKPWTTRNNWFHTDGVKFCHRNTGSNHGETCKGFPSALKGKKEFFVLIYSRYSIDDTQYFYELGNYLRMYKCDKFNCPARV